MKRIITLIAVLSMMWQGMTADEYVDLGLPSKTKWASENENIPSMTFYEVHSIFGESVPTVQQFEELFKYCKATPEGDGVRLKGPNGKSIFLPFDKYHCYSSKYTKSGMVVNDGDYYNNKYTVSHYEQRVELKDLLSFRSVYTSKNTRRDIENDDIDLGLPSGVKWKAMNDLYLYSHKDMCTDFNANTIPTHKEWLELMEQCTWEWIDYGYRIRNKNGKGNYLFLPVDGFVDLSKSSEIQGNKYCTGYWVNSYGEDTPKAMGLFAPSAGKKNAVYYHDEKELYFNVRCVTSYEPHLLCRMYPKLVDMGLPSKTKWFSITEQDEMDWYTATKKFGTGVPSMEEYKELFKYCTVKFLEPYRDFLSSNLYGDILRVDALVTAYNGNQIYIRGGWLWTRTDYNINNVTGAYYIRFLNDQAIFGKSGRTDKMNIHQVRHK